ncbi:hypothetical protein [Roseospira marina]|uniref:hypothetical protein n=1 Tax=Roseospira marina TaxID=140057 RepID=UPI00147850A5|nr:hypothetical protein [Roseospira marina]MBB4312695.1 phosphatidylglycerophosphatase A [Roseospira marina]MBB5086532.1 phosphatidylglycerophosphatase A [Roseospira marina]
MVAVFGVGVWASDVYRRRTGREDPGEVAIDEVVIDEAAGQGLVLTSLLWSLLS